MQELYNSNPYDLLPEALQSPKTQAMGYAVQIAMKKLLEYADKLMVYADLSSLPDEILDSLALELRTRYYDPQAERRIREGLIKQTLEWYMHGGTKSVLREYLATIYSDGKIEEWYEYGADPYYFRAVVTIEESQEIKLGEGARVAVQINALKNVRSWLDALIFRIIIGFSISIQYTNEIKFRIDFWPRRNLEALKLDNTWKLDASKKLTGYNSNKIIDLYPVRCGVRTEATEKVQIGDLIITTENKLDGTWKLTGRRKLNGGREIM